VEELEAVWTGGEGAPVAGVSPYAWPEQGQGEVEVESVPGEPTVGEYLAQLLDWRPGAQAEPEGGAAAEEGAAQEVQPQETSSASEAAAERREADDDDDLEMFRAWLQSLKR
jgi:uncharacterized membrane protein (UPF0182 family)